MQRTGADRRRIISCVISVVLFVLLVLIDQIVKIYIKRTNELANWKTVTVIEGFFSITYTTNSGAAWSFLSGKDWAQTFFKVLTSVALIVFILLFIYATKKNKRFMRISFVLLSAGAVGNFIDRLAYNYVVDFLSFRFGSYSFPVFNVADALMTVGIILLLIDLLFVDSDAVFKTKKDK